MHAWFIDIVFVLSSQTNIYVILMPAYALFFTHCIYTGYLCIWMNGMYHVAGEDNTHPHNSINA